MSANDWLTARPVAHRGLHDLAAGVIENMPQAFAAAVAGGFSIECDVQLSADGEAMVHHDFELGRLTEGEGRLDAMTAAALKAAAFKGTADRMLTLGELCDLVAGRATVLVEVKSRFNGDLRLVRRVARVLASYKGPVAVMSFDPELVAAARDLDPNLARGIVAEARYRHPEWDKLSAAMKRQMAYLLHLLRTRPQFVAYAVNDLPAAGPTVARRVFGLPLLTWTVRTPQERERAKQHADQMIFEGFRP